MTERITAFHSSLYRDATDLLAAAALIAFTTVLLMVCP
jgi:hypothetical protein